VAFPLLRPVNPGGRRTSQSKLSIEDADLSKLLLRLQVRLPMRAEAESKKDRAPTRNPAFRQRPAQLPRREAGNKKGRVPMVNPRVLLRADLPLELSKVRENQRVERKRARKLLHRLAVLRDRMNLRETTAPERSGAVLTVVAAMSAARPAGYNCGRYTRLYSRLKQLRNLYRI